MDQVEFEPASNWTAIMLKADEHPSVKNASRNWGGIHNYQLKLVSESSSPAKVGGSNILGKLQITWRTNLGEPGRLQTQNILGSPFLSKEIELHIVEIPSIVILEVPFLLHLKLSNQTDRKIGPFDVWLSHNDSQEEKAVFVNGFQRIALPLIDAFRLQLHRFPYGMLRV